MLQPLHSQLRCVGVGLGVPSYSAADLRGYQGLDGRHYLLNFHRGLPPEDPSATPYIPPAERGMSIFWRFLRPEFVKRYPRALSADGLSAFGDARTDAWEHSSRVTTATRVLMTASIPNLAVWLAKLGAKEKVRKGDEGAAGPLSPRTQMMLRRRERERARKKKRKSPLAGKDRMKAQWSAWYLPSLRCESTVHSHGLCGCVRVCVCLCVCLCVCVSVCPRVCVL